MLGARTNLNAFEDEFSLTGGVPVRDDAPESSPGLPSAPPGPMRRPLLLREENIEVGPRVTFPLEDRLAEPLRRLRSSPMTWLLFCWKFPVEKFRASPRPMAGRPPPPRWLFLAFS